MRPLLPLMIGWAVACGAAEETLLTELRVISLRADPPLVDTFTGTSVTATVFNPDDDPADVVMWTCTEGGTGCLEAGTEDAPRELSEWVTVSQPSDEELTHAIVPFTGLDGAPITFVWALACTGGLCPLVDTIGANPTAGTGSWTHIIDDLADPFELMKTLPKTGTAASFRTLPVVPLTAGMPIPINPLVTLVSPKEPLTVRSGERVSLLFDVDSSAGVTVFPMATAGGFADDTTRVIDASVTIEFIAGEADSMSNPPIDPGEVIDLYVAFEAEDNGSSLWRGSLSVQ